MDMDPKNQSNAQGICLNYFVVQYGVAMMHGYTTWVIEHKLFY